MTPPAAESPFPLAEVRCRVRNCRQPNPPDAKHCRRCGTALPVPDPAAGSFGMEIPIERPKRIASLVTWGMAVLVVAGVLVWLFVQFTASLRVAMALVVFMLGYMAVMSYVVIRRDDERR